MSAMLGRFVEWSEREAPRRQAYAIAALIGLTANLLVFGLGHFLGTSSFWDLPVCDSRAYMIGYRYFLHEPWHWPPFVVHNMDAPYAKSIAFTDSIPLWAGINKMIATVIPPWGPFSARAYLGLWYGLVWALQACAGLGTMRALGKRTYGTAILAPLFFLSIPFWARRYWHASLSAHFLLLSGLNLYLRTPPRKAPSSRMQIAFVALLFAASMINPYHAAMVIALFLATVLRARDLRTGVLWLPGGIGAAVVGAALAGYFGRESNVVMGGFELASANVFSPFVPIRSVLFGDASKLVTVVATPYQYEGYAYLGLGALVLLALFLPQARKAVDVVKRHPFLFAVALGGWFFSLSNHVYFGSHRILAFEVPTALHWVTEKFRGPGRFVWLPMYVLLLFLFASALERFRRGWQRAIVPAIVLLQIVDGGLGDWNAARIETVGPWWPGLDRGVWTKLIAAHQRVEVHPPYDCILDGTPSLDYISQEIQYFTSERGLPINGVFTPRPTRDCTHERTLRASLEPNDRTLYVLLPHAAALRTRFESMGAHCATFKYGQVCSKERTAIDDVSETAEFNPPPDPNAPTIRVGEKLFLGAAGKGGARAGWSWPEPDGRWTATENAGIVLRLEGEPPETASLGIEASALLCGERTANDVDVFLHGVEVGTFHFDASTNDPKTPRTIPIADPWLLQQKPVLLIELRPRDVRSQKILGCNPETRALGLWVRNVWIESR